MWTPVPGTVKIEKTTQPTQVPVNNASTTMSGKILNETSTTQNSTTKEVKTSSSLLLANGTTKFIGNNQTVVTSITNGFSLQSSNPEVRLVSISALFSLLGASVSGLVSVLTRKLWDTNKHATVRRLLYIYYARPWVGVSVGLVTYVTLRAGLINIGDSSQVSVISEYGVAAISALVGLMTDEIVMRLKDVIRTLFGINDLQKEQEVRSSLQKKSIKVDENIAISAVLTDLKPDQDIIAQFFIQDTNIIETKKADEKFEQQRDCHYYYKR